MKTVYILLSALLLVSCGASVAVDYDTSTNFDSYKTFQFYKPERTQLNDLDIDRVEQAIDSVLVAKSWQRTDYNQFYVSFYVENLEVARSTLGLGVGSGGGGIGIGGGVGIPIGARKFSQTLTIQIFEGVQGSPLVWEGSLSKELREKARPEEKEVHFNTMVAKILSKFPPEKE